MKLVSGSLTPSEIARYERALDEIEQDLQDFRWRRHRRALRVMRDLESCCPVETAFIRLERRTRKHKQEAE